MPTPNSPSFDVGIAEPDQEGPSSGGSKRLIGRIGLIAKIAISGGVLGYLLTRHAPHRVDIMRVDLVPFAAAVFLIVTQVALNAMRWRILLEHCAGNKQSYGRQFQIYYASIFFSQILPSIGSDVVRALYHRKLGASLGQAALSILLDRGVAFIALMLVSLTFLPVLAQLDAPDALIWSVAFVSGGALLAAGMGCMAVSLLRGRSVWSRLPANILVLAENTYWILTSRTAITRLVPLSIFVHLLSIVALALVAFSFHVPLSFTAAIAVGPAYLVAQIIPISVGGWGVREAAAVVLFASLGIDASDAILVSMAFGVVILLAAFPGVLAWLFVRN